MSDLNDTNMPIEEYLARGGRLSSPLNVSARYRGELMRLMATFVDSELAGAAGFADVVNDGPGLKERISASRITLEKLDHAERVLRIMAEFGADSARYVGRHPWTARLERHADIGASRRFDDRRLAVFHYPLDGWTDAVVMNVLMGTAVVVQLAEFVHVSYQPLGDVFRTILPREQHHAELGVEGLKRLSEAADSHARINTCVAYWWPRVATSFGASNPARFETLSRFGLRRTPNETLLERWQQGCASVLEALELDPASVPSTSGWTTSADPVHVD